MTKTFKITEDHKRWASRARSRQRYRKTQPIKFWLDLIQKQDGKCALTGAPLLFDSKNGMPKKGGCHPLYASVDHINPGRVNYGFQIICYDINDLKAHLPIPLFTALKQTREWKYFVKRWKKIAELSKNRRAFKRLAKTGT